MSNEQLPPERPLSGQARAQRRSELMRQITDDGRDRRRWLVPAVAVAAVVAVVAVGGAVLAGGDEPASDNVGPAGGGTSAPAEPILPVDEGSAPAEDDPENVPAEGSSSIPVDEPGFPVESPQPCSDLRIPLPGAEELSSIEIGDTTVRLYGNDSKWIICDEWAALDGGAATLLHPHAFGEPLNQAQLGISMNFSMDDPEIGEYVAGGALPEGVESITYTFSDGHVEEAVLEGDMWAMAYFAHARRILDAATVDVVTNGVPERYTLRGLEGFCNQSNHGC